MSQILILDDDKSMCDMLSNWFSRGHYNVTVSSDSKQALKLIDEADFDCVLTDIQMPHMDGLEFCRVVKEKFPQLPIIVMTAFGSLDVAIEAIKVGAYDFVTKPFEMENLDISFKRALEHSGLVKEVKRLSTQLEKSNEHYEMLGESDAMQEVFSTLDKINGADISVLITGETGTGKELIAKALHKQSKPSGPFVAVNCAALPDSLLESELFGHVKGAFTGAQSQRGGLFLEATNGTLFLDEIGDLPLELQSKLLRVLEDRKIRHVGSDREVPVNFRLVAATSRNLEEMMREGTFREDLYFRLAIMTLELPPLRIRGNDILLLAQFFLKKQASHLNKEVERLSDGAAKHLLRYSWHGNVRELKNIIDRAVVLANHKEIEPSDLPQKLVQYQSREISFVSTDPNEIIPLDEFEKRYVNHVLEVFGGNRSKAAKVLNIDRKTLLRKID